MLKILLVEDESIVAKNISSKLKSLGYSIPAIVSTGEKAIQGAVRLLPDLILMDIRLKGKMDGITAVEKIHNKLDIPVVYLTAYADEKTIKRAKITSPFGYLLKPFNEKELHTTIEIALYKHKMEKALKSSAQWFSTTLISIGDAVMSVDTESRIIFLNPVAESLTGLQQKNITGKKLTELLWFKDPATGESVANPVIDALKSGKSKRLDDTSLIIKKNGKEIFIDSNAAPITDEKGNISGGVLVFRDITDQKWIQAQLEQSSKLAAVGQLAAGVAHEINNPNNSIINYAQVIADRVESGTKPYNYARQIIKEGHRIANIVKSLLSFAHETKERMSVTNFPEIMADTLALIKPQIRNDHIDLKVDISKDIPPIIANGQQIQQVIMNIITNAQYALNQKYPRADKNKTLTVTAKKVETNSSTLVRITMEDKGVGIPANILNQVMNPFFSTKPRGKGTGLGLSISYGIIQNHGGKLEIDSTEDKYTKVIIDLPVKRN